MAYPPASEKYSYENFSVKIAYASSIKADDFNPLKIVIQYLYVRIRYAGKKSFIFGCCTAIELMENAEECRREII